MNTSICIYTAYFLVSLGMTIWVARTLHKNGRLFLVEAFTGNQALADSVNHLLLVGFLSDQPRLHFDIPSCRPETG